MDKENKEKLDKIYQSMRANMAKVELLSMFSHEVFEDFPTNLPEKTINHIKSNLSRSNEIKDQMSSIEFTLLSKEQYEKLGLSQRFFKFLNGMSIILSSNLKLEDIELEQIMFKQEFISLYSYLEGYFQDLHRLLFENDKTLLSNKDKDISIDKILKADDYNQLLSQIIDEKLAKSGYEKISSIIEKWKKEPFKIILKLKKVELKQLDKFACIRNIIVHNNSKVDENLFSFLDNNKYQIGQSYKLDLSILKEFEDLVFNTVFQAYSEICFKYPILDEN
jgi:hypothetical protein